MISYSNVEAHSFYREFYKKSIIFLGEMIDYEETAHRC